LAGYSEAEAADVRDHYMQMRTEGEKPGDMGGNSNDSDDPLNAFPRFINMQDWDAQTTTWHEENTVRPCENCAGRS